MSLKSYVRLLRKLFLKIQLLNRRMGINSCYTSVLKSHHQIPLMKSSFLQCIMILLLPLISHVIAELYTDPFDYYSYNGNGLKAKMNNELPVSFSSPNIPFVKFIYLESMSPISFDENCCSGLCTLLKCWN